MTGYRVSFLQQAANVLQTFSAGDRRIVLEKLKYLAAHAVKFNRSAHYPEPPGFRVFDFSIQVAGEPLRIRTFFKYLTNEQDISIHLITLGDDPI